MILWRGWGILGLLIILAFGGLAAGIGSSVASSTNTTVWLGGGFVLGGAVAAFVGWYMNIARPAQKAEEWQAERSAQLQHLVQSGQFQLAPGIAQPTSLAQAQQQADQLLASESEQVRRNLRGRHTVWFIPMEWLGVVGAVIGVILVIVGFTA